MPPPEIFGFVEAPALREAAIDAYRLLATTTEVLADGGWLYVERRPIWYVRHLRRFVRGLRLHRTPAAKEDLGEFLAAMIEPCVMLLLLSIRLEAGQLPPARMLFNTEPVLLDRTRRLDAEGLDLYFGALMAEEAYEASLLERALGWVGVSRHRHVRRSPRTYYNLACLLSRWACRLEDGGTRAKALEMAAMRLRRAMEGLGAAQRRRQAHWAWEDPGLEGFRSLDPYTFGSIVGAPPTIPPLPGPALGAPERRQAG